MNSVNKREKESAGVKFSPRIYRGSSVYRPKKRFLVVRVYLRQVWFSVFWNFASQIPYFIKIRLNQKFRLKIKSSVTSSSNWTLIFGNVRTKSSLGSPLHQGRGNVRTLPEVLRSDRVWLEITSGRSIWHDLVVMATPPLPNHPQLLSSNQITEVCITWYKTACRIAALMGTDQS